MDMNGQTNVAPGRYSAGRGNEVKRSYVREELPIKRSFPEAASMIVTPEAGKPIRYGDKIFVRLTMMGRVVLEMMVTKVCDYSELLAEVRRQVRHLRGLAMLSVRNMLRGWSDTRPIMLYRQTAGVSDSRQARPAYAAASPTGSLDFNEPAPRMLCPWETH